VIKFGDVDTKQKNDILENQPVNYLLVGLLAAEWMENADPTMCKPLFIFPKKMS
jgi:hypothetical protein